jgi:hypothetical protein
VATKKNKDFTGSDGAIERFFSQKDTQHTQDAQHTQYTQDAQHTQHTQDAQYTQHTQDAQHTQHARSRRNERFGLLLDKQLKEDLFYLSKATGSKSINDFLITILLEYLERPENQLILEKYKELLVKNR